MAAHGKNGLRLQFRPLTSDRFADLETLFGPHGATGGCWCMWWRRTAKEFGASKGEENRAAFRALVEAGAEPGILAYADEEPVGWCAVAPREEYPRLIRSRMLKPMDDRPVWSITCFFVARSFRRRGVTRGLIEAACGFVLGHGGRIVEAYPVAPDDNGYPAAFAYTGLLSAFLACGFAEVARPSARRAIVRRALRP
jgi:GNAT superfamily N-acetyltransferase